MLYTYQQLTRLLLADAGFTKFNDFDLQAYINQARLQIAGQGRCIREYVTLPLATGQQVYPFSAISAVEGVFILGSSVLGGPDVLGTGGGLDTGVSGIYHIRQAWMTIPGVPGQLLMYSRPFEWFALYELNSFSPPSGQPKRWAQFGQGVEGSIFVAPIPDLPYALILDALGVPMPLATDADIEALPDIWTLPVPFYAAWYALQTAQQHDAADKMMQRFQEQMALARSAANPDLIMENWSLSPDAEQANRLGVQPRMQ